MENRPEHRNLTQPTPVGVQNKKIPDHFKILLTEPNKISCDLRDQLLSFSNLTIRKKTLAKMLVTGLLLMALSVTHQSEAQITTLGGCPDIQAKTEFDFYRYQGIWFKMETYSFLTEIIGTCMYGRYKNFHPENATFESDNVFIENFTRRQIVTPCTGRLTGHQDRSAKIDLRINVPVPLSPVAVIVEFPFYVLDTDYNSYAIEWSCKQIGIHNTQYLWIIARTRTFPQETKELVHEKLRELGLRPDLLIPSDQTNCPAPIE